MRAARFAITASVVTAVAVTIVAGAAGTRFADQPCPEAGPGGIRICPATTIGKRYAVRLLGNAGCGPALPYQYRLLNGALPPGISLSSDGRLTGVPMTAGNWAFWVELSDQDPPSASWCIPKKSQREFLIHVGAPPATVGSLYALTLGAVGDGQHSWSIVAGVLPSGLTLDAAGVIVGTPENAGSFPLVLSARDSSGATSAFDFTLTVYPQLSVATTRLARAWLGRLFFLRVRTTGAVGAVNFRVVSGRFPIGVRLNVNTGVIRGRPRTAGAFSFALQVRDSLGRTASRKFALTVRR
jgi:hypothetical protein